MKIHQHAAKPPELVQIDGRVIYKCPGFTIRTDFPSQNELLFTVQLFFCEELLHFFQMMNTKAGFHYCLPVSTLKNRSICSFSKHQREGTGNNGFACPGFSCDHLEAL